ncbi:MAG: PAS domain-containing sensor histidine kinase [Spirochaetes bacterium]|nr:PAS domain-containing sensor histidine kinase [Spirochaetota bacterium]
MKSDLSVKLLIDNINISLLMLDSEGRIIQSNATAEKLFKKTRIQLLNKTMHDLLKDFEIRDIKEWFLKNNNKPLKRNALIISRTDETGVSMEIAPIIHGKQYNGAIVTCINISGKMDLIKQLSSTQEEFKKRTNQIAEERDRFHMMIESISDGVLLLNNKYNIILFNSSMRKLIGVSAKRLTNTPLKKYLKEVYYSELFRKMKYFQSETIEIMNQEGDKSKKIVSAYMAPLIIQRGEELEFLLTIRDITREKQLDEMKSQFVSNVSHELRTPLSSIKGFTATLLARKGLSGEQKKRFLTIIDHESDRLTRLIEDLLSLSRIETSSFKLQFSEFDLKKLFEELKHEFEHLLKEKKLGILINFGKLLPKMNADRDKIFQLLVNLLNNAVKFTNSNTDIEIKSLFRKADNCFVITIKDKGPGISRKNLEKIFEKFFRIEDSIHTIPGTGLGLSIVQGIVEKHNGRIMVKSQPGRGARFIVEIPQGMIPYNE